MILKRRSESDELLKLRYLNTRMELMNKEKFYYFNLERGFEGEVKFDLLAENILEERYIIHDLLLEINNSYIQIDTLMISQEVIYLLDVKNFQGDFYLESDKLYSVSSNLEYKNPVDQIKRSMTTPFYNYEQLQKGVYCESCKSFLMAKKNLNLVCEKCGKQEKLEPAILRNKEEYRMLFPDHKITTNSIYEWCKIDLNTRTVHNVLKKHYTSYGNTSDTYYR